MLEVQSGLHVLKINRNVLFTVQPILEQKSFTCEINENGFTNECGFKFKSNPQYQQDIYG